MNEADRAEGYAAEEELLDLGVPPNVLEQVERMWLANDHHDAAATLANATKRLEADRLSVAAAWELLRRNYGGPKKNEKKRARGEHPEGPNTRELLREAHKILAALAEGRPFDTRDVGRLADRIGQHLARGRGEGDRG